MADIEKNAGQEDAVKKAKKTASVDSTKSGKKKKDEKENKNIFSRNANWFKDLRKEFKKVVWPTRKKVFNNTLVVLAVVVIGSVVVGLIDTGLLRLMQFLMGLSN